MSAQHTGARPRFWGPAPSLVVERDLAARGLALVAGVDEVGRGCLAGPVLAAAVILPLHGAIESDLAGVRDSKTLTARQRDRLATLIRRHALACAVGSAEVEAIATYNILGATRQAMRDAIARLDPQPDALAIDAIRLPGVGLPQTPIIKGDQRSLSIAAASILAKVARDALMIELDALFPGYGFACHKGYGTARHLAALAALGPCPQHRATFAPVRTLIDPDRPRQAALLS